MAWLFFNLCRKHHARLQWDGSEQTYICPACAKESI